MERVDLIPAPRREAKARRAYLRVLARLLAVYAALMLTVYGACYALSGEDTQTTVREAREVAADVKRANQEMRSLAGEMAEIRRRLEAARAVAGHPDWSLLLTLLADAVGEEVVLRHCLLAPVEGDPAGGAGGQDALGRNPFRSYRFEVKGFAKTQAAVSRFVLRLEGGRLFDQVKLVRTNRQVFLDAQAVAFELECSLGGDKRTASR